MSNKKYNKTILKKTNKQTKIINRLSKANKNMLQTVFFKLKETFYNQYTCLLTQNMPKEDMKKTILQKSKI